MEHEPQEQYDGPARIGDAEVAVRLRGYFQPIDGRFHWWGRIDQDPALDGHTSGSTIVLETPHGRAEARLSDIDPWGRFRVTGTGRPPF
ncbi:MAG: hypothetical protein JWR90_3319 [Marmoricola sp.]|jgi:hypothetical protein|nr:hypothetical protein [Marmoricola sp.]